MSKIIQKVKLYNGEVIVEKKEGRFGHEYYVNGKRTTGCTTFLSIKDKSRPLIYWAVGLARDYLLERCPQGIQPEDVLKACKLHAEEKVRTANIGTAIHDWIEQYIKGKKPEMPDDDNVVRGVHSFLEWKDQHKVKFKSTEKIIYSRKYDYCGSLDFEAEIDGKLYLGDFKTGNSLYNEVLMQTAAYAEARREESGIEYDGRYLLRVAKETEEEHATRTAEKRYAEPYKVFEAIPVMSGLKDDMRAFRAFQQGYIWDKESEKRLKALKNENI